MRPETVRRHRRAISRALAYIADRDEERFSLKDIAAHAAMSPFHFEHVYQSYVGEPVMKTVRHRRLRLAQLTLRVQGRKVSTAGECAGYSSGQAFARAFKRTTGLTPSDSRRASAPAPLPPPLRLVTLDEQTVHGIAFHGNYADEADAFDELVGHAYADVDMDAISRYRRNVRGITILPEAWPCNGQSTNRIVTVAADNMPARYSGQIIPGRQYAVMRHTGSLPDAGSAIRAARERIPYELGLVPTDHPLLCEWMTDAALLPSDQFILDIFVPVSR